MTYRFDKNFRILAGFLLETEYKGHFIYLDPITGERVRRNPKNLYLSVGYPGSTLYYRAPLPGRENQEEPPDKIVHDANLALDEEGFLVIKMKDGRIIEHGKTRRLVHMAKDIEKFHRFMQDKVNGMNEDVDTLLSVHKEAVSPNAPRLLYPEVFYEPYPERMLSSRFWFLGIIAIILVAYYALPDASHPSLLIIGLVAATLLMLYLRIKGIRNYDDSLSKWEARKREFEEKQQDFLKSWKEECECGEDHNAVLGLALDSFDWPRDTNVSFEFRDGGKELYLDMDLPAWDELPAQAWRIGGDKVTLERSIISPYDRRERYVRHVHSLAFLAASIAFWSTPSLETLYLSAFCENYTPPDPAIGNPPPDPKKKVDPRFPNAHPVATPRVEHEPGTGEPAFLLSLKINRDDWAKLNFDNLHRLNPVHALEDFEMRRDLDTQHMILNKITPF